MHRDLEFGSKQQYRKDPAFREASESTSFNSWPSLSVHTMSFAVGFAFAISSDVLLSLSPDIA